MAIAFIILGFIAGIASGMFGIGGGLIIVPVLTVLFGFGQKEATGTSLAVILLPVSLFAVINYYRAGHLKVQSAAWVAAGIVVGSIVGAWVAIKLPVNDLKHLYGFFLLWMAWRFFEPRKFYAERRGGKAAAPPAPAADQRFIGTGLAFGLLVLGFAAGIGAGLFGIGGGVIIVPVLMSLFNFEQREAVGTSLAALLLPVGLGAVIQYYNDNLLNLTVAALIALGLVGGAFAGAKIALGLPTATVKRLYGVFLFLVALRFIFSG
jgi:uncharacterized membrane protein YfcA